MQTRSPSCGQNGRQLRALGEVPAGEKPPMQFTVAAPSGEPPLPARGSSSMRPLDMGREGQSLLEGTGRLALSSGDVSSYLSLHRAALGQTRTAAVTRTAACAERSSFYQCSRRTHKEGRVPTRGTQGSRGVPEAQGGSVRSAASVQRRLLFRSTGSGGRGRQRQRERGTGRETWSVSPTAVLLTVGGAAVAC